MFGRKKKQIDLPPAEPLPDKADLYFKVYGTTKHQDELTKVADDILNKVDAGLLYHRFTDTQIKDLGLTVDEIDNLRYYMSIIKSDLGYDVVCKHGQIGFMPEHMIPEYEDLDSKYKKKTVNVSLSGGKAKFYNKDKDKMCFEWSDYEAKCHVTFKEPL